MPVRYLLILLITLFGISSSSYSQTPDDLPPELVSKITGKKRYAEIMNEVDKYYRSNNYQTNPKLFSQYKKWNRWAWWAVRHLNEQGEVEPKTAEYFEEARKMKAITNANTTASPTSTGGTWTSVGPFSTTWGNAYGSRGIGRIDRLVFHPTNPNIILAGSPAGGVWRTNNGGTNWFSISSSVPNCGIAGIVFGNNDPSGNTIYILTGDLFGSYFLSNFNFNQNSAGVLVTYNGGFTWNKLGNSETALKNLIPFKLIQLRNNPNILIAVTNGGPYSTTDFGVTWNRIAGTRNDTYDIEQHPTNDAIVYYSTSNTVGKSTDFGQTFTEINSFTPATGSATRSQLAITPANPNEVYYLQCGGTNSIYKSTNSGDNFSRINTANLMAGQFSYNYAFAINPFNNNFMVAAGITLAASSNNGATFPNVTVAGVNLPGPVPNNYLHSDVHDLAYNPLNGLLYAGSDGGVSVSNDNGVNWTDISNGLQCTQYYHMDGFENVQNLYIGGTQDNGSNYTTNGGSMVYAGSGDGFAVDFVNTNNDFFFMVENNTVSRYRRSTNSLSQVSNTIPAANRTFFPDVICHPTNGNIAYIAYANTVWRTTDQGTSWTQVATISNNDGGAGFSRTYNGGFAVSAQVPDRIYAASANTVRISNNQGSNWTTISGNTGWPASFGTITDIATRSNNANEIWVTTTGNNGANRIIYSSNAGASWVNFTGSLPNVPVYSIFYTAEGDAYIGTELGVFFMDFSMNDWVPFYNGLPVIPVTDLFVNEAAGTIAASTMGRGIWLSDLYSDCGPFMFLSGLTQGANFYQSNGFIETKQEVPGSYGNQLRLRSPTKIIFKAGSPGFSIKAGAYMHAVIGNCGQGVFSKESNSATVISKEEYLKLNRTQNFINADTAKKPNVLLTQ